MKEISQLLQAEQEFPSKYFANDAKKRVSSVVAVRSLSLALVKDGDLSIPHILWNTLSFQHWERISYRESSRELLHRFSRSGQSRLCQRLFLMPGGR